MRIVAGKFRGVPLVSPAGGETRPTSDRVREALFNILMHGIADFTLDGARVLDLFAGTGALGLEALSRGAAFCLFVDDAAAARGVIRENIEKMQLTGDSKVFRRDATSLGPAGTTAAFHLVFIDPPYGQGLGERAMRAALDGHWLASGAVVVLEESVTSAFVAPVELSEIDSRDYGDTRVRFLRYGTTGC